MRKVTYYYGNLRETILGAISRCLSGYEEEIAREEENVEKYTNYSVQNEQERLQKEKIIKLAKKRVKELKSQKPNTFKINPNEAKLLKCKTYFDFANKKFKPIMGLELIEDSKTEEGSLVVYRKSKK